MASTIRFRGREVSTGAITSSIANLFVRPNRTNGITVIRKRALTIVILFFLCLLYIYFRKQSSHGSVGRHNMRWSTWFYSFLYIPGRNYVSDIPATDLPVPHYPLLSSTTTAAGSSSSSSSSLSSSPILFPQRWKGIIHSSNYAYCEQFYGNTWLREFIDSRKLSCLPPKPSSSSSSSSTLPYSTIASYEPVHGARLYWMKNIALDFNQIKRIGNQRTFLSGFIKGKCENIDNPLFLGGGHDEPALSDVTWINLLRRGNDEQYRGNIRHNSPSSFPTDLTDDVVCDIWEDKPTIIIQHDDIGNHYHNLADFWRIWVAAAILTDDYICEPDTVDTQSSSGNNPSLSPTLPLDSVNGKHTILKCPSGSHLSYGTKPEDIQILNLDSRIMCGALLPDGITPDRTKDEEDCTSGPYFPQYSAWFPYGIKRPQQYFTTDTKDKHVCFRSVAFAASLPFNQIWEGFNEDTGCDQSSALMTQYVDFTMKQWKLQDTVPWNTPKHGNGTVNRPNENEPYIRIGYIMRKKKPYNNGKPITSRIIANEDEFIETVIQAARTAFHTGILNRKDDQRRIDQVNVDFIPLEFTDMPYREQLELIRSMHIIIGMHGAGMAHCIHLAKRDACGGRTGVIELLDLPSKNTRGIQHLAGMADHPYYRLVNYDPEREIGDKGTVIDTKELQTIVQEAVRKNIQERQC